MIGEPPRGLLHCYTKREKLGRGVVFMQLRERERERERINEMCLKEAEARPALTQPAQPLL